MKQGFYFRLAASGIRKNRRLYLPYLLTCTGMVMMYYMIAALAYSTPMQDMMGRTTMGVVLEFGKFVMAVFSFIFLFYTNSFLTRRRKKEFGLYNVLGMSKRHLARILLAETLIVTILSLAGGIASGVVFSKLAELVLLRLLREEINYHVMFSTRAVIEAAAVYLLIYLVLLIYNVLQVGINNPLALMRSEAVGEKPPRAKWIMTVLGALLLGGAYYLAVSIEDPIQAFSLFFVAVLMVIVATYLLLISGSVTLCRFLQKRKKFYYQSKHFVSVASMTYRMKRAGAGLASICILSTMVLVTLSSTSCMYFGMEDMISTRYPYSLSLDVITRNPESWEAMTEDFPVRMTEGLEKNGITVTDCVSYHSAGVLCNREGTDFSRSMAFEHFGNEFCLILVPLEDYNRLVTTPVTLNEGEALAFAPRDSYAENEVNLDGIWSARITAYLESFPENADSLSDLASSLYLVIPDGRNTIRTLWDYYEAHQDYRLALDWYYQTQMEDDSLYAQARTVCDNQLCDLAAEKNMDYWYTLETREGNRSEFYALYGGLFFLGVLLSIVFLSAAVLMIYYKQVSEGYEDQARFGIMQKVGMTSAEIRKSVNSQILTVFFLPLLLAGIHLAFAFPMVNRVLILLQMRNTPLLIATTLGCFSLFALFYSFVYKLTSNSYYAIVCDPKGGEKA